jgi:DNA-binding transcriptional regulator YiaG
MKKYGIPRKDTRYKKGVTSWIKGKKLDDKLRQKLSDAHVKKRVAKEELYKLYWEHKFSQERIAQILGVSRSAIEKWMRDYAIPRRP